MNLGNCTCNFPSCWRGWDHARRQYLRSWRVREDSPGTHDFVPPALPAARALCNRARTGLPGPSLTFFLSFPGHDQAIDPKAHGSWRVPVVPLLLPIGVSGARGFLPDNGHGFNVLRYLVFVPTCWLASLFLISSVCHPNSPGMHFPSSLDSLQKTLALHLRSTAAIFPQPTDFVGKVCLPRITIPVFEIEPGSAHTHTSQLGTRYHAHLHTRPHKTTSQTLLRPSKPELDSFVFWKIESFIASRNQTTSGPRQRGIRSTEHSIRQCSTLREYNNTLVIWTHRSGAQDKGCTRLLDAIHLTGLQHDSRQRA